MSDVLLSHLPHLQVVNVQSCQCIDRVRNLDRVNGYFPQELRVSHCRCAGAPARAGTGRWRAADGRSVRAAAAPARTDRPRSEEHTSELQSPDHLVCRLLLEKKKMR